MRYAWEECGVIPRFYLEHAIRTEDLARAVLRGEVNAMAIDVRGEGFSAIAQIRREVPEMILDLHWQMHLESTTMMQKSLMKY